MKTNPDVLKVLVALAVNLRKSAANVREKELACKEDLSQYPYSKAETISKLNEQMAFQGRAMHHALFNAFFVAKKAAGRKKLF